MSEPVVFISRFRIHEGSTTALDALTREIVAGLDRDKPDTIAQLFYRDEAGELFTVVHVFPDAAAMDRHFAGADERSRAAYDHMTPDGWEILGRASAEALEMMRGAAATSGVSLALRGHLVDGFIHPTPAWHPGPA